MGCSQGETSNSSKICRSSERNLKKNFNNDSLEKIANRNKFSGTTIP